MTTEIELIAETLKQWITQPKRAPYALDDQFRIGHSDAGVVLGFKDGEMKTFILYDGKGDPQDGCQPDNETSPIELFNFLARNLNIAASIRDYIEHSQ